MSKKQIILKYLKGRVGVIGRRMSEKILLAWKKTIHRCAEVSRAIDKLCFPTDHINQHKELHGGHIRHDIEDFNKIKK